MPVKLLKDFLDKNNIKYMCITHSPAFTAQEIAAAAHISGKTLAKTVMVKINGQLAMMVLPAHDYINFSALKEMLGTNEIDLATEMEFKSKFPECEAGAMPPFGNLYNMPVFLASSLTPLKQLTFNAGSHSELIQLSYWDFERLVKPRVISFQRRGELAA